MYKINHIDGMAKQATLTTPHGEIQTPVFMNVATAAAIKGALSAKDLADAGCQVALCNTYHLHVRPGEGVVNRLGGIHKFMAYDGPILTDSGGYQVFSLAARRKIKEEGVYFSSHVDGRKIFMGPNECIEVQSALASTIAMAFDECPPFPCDKQYMEDSVKRTTRWLSICKKRLQELNTQSGAINPKQMLFAINQGGIYPDIRIKHAKEIVEMDTDGYAIGGLSVGEKNEEMYNILETVVPHMDKNKPTYLMGVGTPENILEAVARGVDFFDCVLPARNGRHGNVYSSLGKLNLFNAKYEYDDGPIDPNCGCDVCKTFSRAYIRHLFKAKEMLAMRLSVMHNLFYYNNMMREIRESIANNFFDEYKMRKLNEMRL